MTMKLPEFGLSIHISESQTEQQLLRDFEDNKIIGLSIHIFESQTEQLL